METVRLGTTGLQVSPICFGTWRFGKETGGVMETDREQAHELLDTLAAAGGNFIDTANGYGDGRSEEWIGEWLADRDREEYVLASKCYWSTVSQHQENLSRKNVRAEVAGSLDRLDTDYLDILYLHRWDEGTPIETTLRTLDDLVSEGKVHNIGLSTAAAWRLTKGLYTADLNDYERFSVTQPQFSATHREPVADYLDVCAAEDVAVCPYSPLHGGFLTGKYQRTEDGGVTTPSGSRGDIDEQFSDWYLTDDAWDVLDAVETVAAEADATPAQAALRWLMDQSAFTCVPIIGARTPEQLEENLAAVDVSLSADQHGRITAANE